MTWKLFYDGGCNLCHRSKLRVENWAERAGQELQVDVLQSEEGLAKGYGAAMVLEADRVYTGADAWIKLMQIAPWHLRWIGWLGAIWPFRMVMRWGYSIVDRFRYKWFGTRECKIGS